MGVDKNTRVTPVLVAGVHASHDPFMDREYFVYLLASAPYGTLYCGVTNDLVRRVYEHREGHGSHFTQTYKVTRLVWFTAFGEVTDAIAREKTIKGYKRQWKINLIEETNPDCVTFSTILFEVCAGLERFCRVRGLPAPRENPDGFEPQTKAAWIPVTSTGMTRIARKWFPAFAGKEVTPRRSRAVPPGEGPILKPSTRSALRSMPRVWPPFPYW